MKDAEDSGIMKRELTAAEVLMGFLCWLTVSPTPMTFSRDHTETVAVELFVELFRQYAAVNNLGDIGADWPDCLMVPGSIAALLDGTSGRPLTLEELGA